MGSTTVVPNWLPPAMAFRVTDVLSAVGTTVGSMAGAFCTYWYPPSIETEVWMFTVAMSCTVR